ncbi:MAG: DUF1080 domain-containing protein [Pirellulales bacterium]|nr:DUF1080 domain-containing protein [Pirellulales bacterium]
MSPNTRWLWAVAVGLSLSSRLIAEESENKPEAITDTSKAGADFAIQGEYIGEFNLGDGVDQKFGLQVISLGEGKYQGVAYFGGLPGDGWDGFSKLPPTDGESVDGVVKLVANEGSAEIKDGQVTIKTNDDQQLGTMKKTERKSPTEGQAPPEGAIVLFDGSSADAFEGGKLTADKLLAGGCKSKQKFQDFTLHLEFRTPFMPKAKGQARGNSGVYLQDRYEVQVLDSFGLEGLDDECGAIYSKKAPRENMCYPPLCWQTYDIEFTAAKFEGDKKVKNATVTVKHNGSVIHENVEVDGPTAGGAAETAEPGAIQLQDHGNPVVFRNIWIVEKKG